MKKLSKAEWIGVVAAVLVVGFSLFGASISNLFGSKLMNTNMQANLSTANPNGVIIRDLEVGKGVEIKSGEVLTINYILTLPDGTVIQNSKEMGAPYQFQYGVNRQIPGFEQGIVGMRVGGVRTIEIPPEMAYGSQANGPIPANSTLIFTIELLDATDVPPQSQ